VHTCLAVDAFRGFRAGLRRSAFSLGVVPPLLLLIPSPEANEKYTRNFPPFFYRCTNGQTLVSRLEYEDQNGDGEVLSVYPYPVKEHSQVLWRSAGRQYIAVGGQQYDCRPWKRKSYLDATESTLPFIKVPDADELRVYAQRFKATQYRCEGGYAVRLWVTDFRDAGRGDHGLMEVNDREQFGHYLTRGNSGSFNGKERSDPGLAFYWFISYEPPYRIKRNLVIKNEAFSCEMVQK
jgi:hypothetical protein